MRHRVFEDNEDYEIDKYDIEVSLLMSTTMAELFSQLILLSLISTQCKEWGFLCRELFGLGLGTRDYDHFTIEHSPMLMRRFKSMARYSNQGYEAADKVHRQLYAQCTNHYSSASEPSSKWNTSKEWNIKFNIWHR